MHRLRLAQQNLLSVWREEDYSIRTSRMALMKQDYVLCNSPDTVRRVFLEQHDNYDRKSPQMRRALEPLLDDGLFVSDGDLWHQRRRQCAPSLTNALLPGFCTTMTASAEETAKRWAQHPADAPIDMLTEMAHLTARIIGRTIFGDDTTDEEAEQVVAGFTEYQRHSEHLDMANMLGLPFLSLLGNPLRRARTRYSAKQVHEIIDRIIDRHTHRSGQGQHSLIESFMTSMKDGGDNGCPMGRKAVRNEAIVMFMAGHETTANALAWCWVLFLIMTFRLWRAGSMNLMTCSAVVTPCFEDVAKLPYTMAVFEEAMRLYPPVPMLSRQARGDDKVRNRDVREGTVLLVSPWLLHRHRKLWEAPDHFVPERFLPEVSYVQTNLLIYPLAWGHVFVSANALGFTKVFLSATLAQHFTPKLVTGHQVNIECRLTLRPQGGLPMMLQPR